jgi:hypothetical protein
MAALFHLSIGDLSILLCTIILALIPLIIWMIGDLDNRKRNGWSRHGNRRFFRQNL